MTRYIVYIPAYEVTVDAEDDLEAFEKAIETISIVDTKIEVVGSVMELK